MGCKVGIDYILHQNNDFCCHSIPAITFICGMKFSLRHQSTGKIFPILEPLSHSMFYGYFSQVFLHNMAGVPSDKPVLLAGNHPTAFVDPMLLCCYLEPPIYNMTRGDIFSKPFFRKFMEGINMFPVYRMRDGYGSRDRNDEVFEYCIGKLYQRRVVTIYVEGEHHLEKRVRPIQKGIARIAFAAYERHRLDDLQIIPAGCSYVSGDQPRDEAMVSVGAPILVKDYWDDYERDSTAAILRLCKDIENALKEVCLHIESKDDDVLAEQLLTLHRSDHPFPTLPVIVHNSPRFAGEKAVLDRLNALPESEKSNLKEKTGAYFAALERAGLNDAALRNPGKGAWTWLAFFALGFLPWMIGYLSSWPLARLAKWVADTKVKKREFYSSVRMGVAMLAGIPYYLILMLICFMTGKPLWIALGLSLVLLGWFAQYYGDVWRRWRAARKALGSRERAALLAMRPG